MKYVKINVLNYALKAETMKILNISLHTADVRSNLGVTAKLPCNLPRTLLPKSTHVILYSSIHHANAFNDGSTIRMWNYFSFSMNYSALGADWVTIRMWTSNSKSKSNEKLCRSSFSCKIAEYIGIKWRICKWMH